MDKGIAKERKDKEEGALLSPANPNHIVYCDDGACNWVGCLYQPKTSNV